MKNATIDIGRVVAPAPRGADARTYGAGVGHALEALIARRGLPAGITAREVERIVIDAPAAGMSESQLAAAIYESMLGRPPR
jgi:hypothetical protein